MIGTFLVAVAALIIAVLGCAWVKPVGLKENRHDTVDGLWAREKVSRDQTARPQER